MEDLELLKKDWEKKSDDFKSYSKNDLFKMIQNNTTSISKKLLTIGLAEVALWFLFLFLDKEKSETFFDIKVIIRSVLFVAFIFTLVYYYRKINNSSDLKKLVKSILGLRKVILIYVGLVFFSILVFTLVEAKEDTNDMIRGWVDGYNSGKNSFNDSDQMTVSDFEPNVGYFFYGISMIIFIIILFLIYDYIYGGLLKKLKINYDELTKIEERHT